MKDVDKAKGNTLKCLTCQSARFPIGEWGGGEGGDSPTGQCVSPVPLSARSIEDMNLLQLPAIAR